jgi:hypothetical protein
MNKIFLLSCLLMTLYSQSQHTNIMVGNTNNPEEPSIMINPKNPKYIVAGANITNAYFSSDTGRTWTSQILTSSYTVWGDPVIICDTNGHFYFFHLTNPPGPVFVDRMVAQKSFNNGVTWNDGSYFGLNPPKHQDKEWAIVDRKTNTIYASWTQFDNYGSTNPADSSHILFVKSVDGGATWSVPTRLDQQGGDCIDDDNTVEGAVPAVGTNGEVYVAWAGPLGLVFDKSLDGGITWAPDKIVSSIGGGWAYEIPGIYRANGLPVTVCDVSKGPHRGTIYINWSDQRNGTTDTDVWLVKSTDGGNTWSAPKRVNDDAPGKHQFFTWMDVDQTNGYLYFVFYDRRNYSDDQTDVYMARSTDGGNSFKNFKISSSPFVPSKNIFFGDYNNISVTNGIIRPMWTRMENGALSVWTALVDTTKIPGITTPVTNINDQLESLESYPNPFTNNSYISFRLKKTSTVSISIFDMSGRLISNPVIKKRFAIGKYIERIDHLESGILPGQYFYTIIIDNKLYARKMIKIE